MAEPVVIDNIPVKLTPHQQKLWNEGRKRKVRTIIRKKRLEKQYTEEELASMEKAPSFNEVMDE